MPDFKIMREFRFTSHDEDEVEHPPSGVRFPAAYPLVPVPGTWPTKKLQPSGQPYDLNVLKEAAELFLVDQHKPIY